MSHIRKISYETKSGKKKSVWLIDFYWNSKRYTKSLKTSDKQIARKLQHQIDKRIEEHKFNPGNIFGSTDKTIGVFIDEFKAYLLSQNLDKKTIVSYFYTLDMLLKIVHKDTRIDQIDSLTVDSKIIPYLSNKYTKK